MRLPTWTKVPSTNGIGLQFSVATGEIVVPGREAEPYPLCPSTKNFNGKNPHTALKIWHRSIDKIMSDATFTTDVLR